MRSVIIPRGRSDRHGFPSPSRSKSRTKSRSKSSAHRSSRYIYDDDDAESRRDSVASNLAEDGDNVSISDQLDMDGFACGLCEPVCCGQEVFIEDDSRDLDELRELRREIDDMKRMIVVEKSGAPYAPSRSPRDGPPSPRQSMQVDMKRQETKKSKLIKLFDNDLVQINTEDEQEKIQRVRYYASIGRQGYVQQEEQGGTWADFLQCSNFCITWNNCERGQDDNMSDISPITDAMDLPWSDDYQRNVIEAPSMRAEPPLVYSRNARPSYTSVSNPRSPPSYTAISVSPTKKTFMSKAVTAGTPSTKSMSKSTPSSNGRNGALPLNKMVRLRSPLQSRNKKVPKVKARKVLDDRTGSIMFEC